MPKFAAYDAASIYAVAGSAEEAVAQARHDAGAPDATFETAHISDNLAAWIAENGWNGSARSFDVIRSEIVDTTDE